MRGSPSGDAAVSGGVGQAILPHRTEMEKVCPLNGGDIVTACDMSAPNGECGSVRVTPPLRGYHFSLSSHFRGFNSL